MLFLLAVVGAALAFGRGPAIVAAIVNVLAFDFFFVPPQFTFAVTDAQYVFTFVVMLIVGLVVGQLTARLGHQARFASQGEERARRLFEMARELSAALAPEQVGEIGERYAAAASRGKAAVLMLEEDETLRPAVAEAGKVDDRHGDRALVRRPRASPRASAPTRCRPPASCTCPLKAPVRTRGVARLRAGRRGPAADSGAAAGFSRPAPR